MMRKDLVRASLWSRIHFSQGVFESDENLLNDIVLLISSQHHLLDKPEHDANVDQNDHEDDRVIDGLRDENLVLSELIE
jgi:hypothetical protein